MLYYTFKDVAELLGVTVQTIYYRTKLKPKHHLYIKSIELGKNIHLIPSEEYERLKNDND